MKNINSLRVSHRNQHQPNPNADYVLYWMSINRRLHYNFALEYAVAWANKLGKPLLIYEGLSCNIPWASDRTHTFLIEGMQEHHEFFLNNNINFYSYIEKKPSEGAGLVENLASNACMVIADEYPVYIIKPYNRLMAKRVNIPWVTIDSNGLIPMNATDKAPYSAFVFRRQMQKLFLQCYNHPPEQNPLEQLKNTTKINLPTSFLQKYPDASDLYTNIPELVSTLQIDHEVHPVTTPGTRQAALKQLDDFVEHRLHRYHEERNDPDLNMVSGLSPWLHYGKISAYEVVKATLSRQPKDWDTSKITYQNGSRPGFFGGHPYIDAFLDELITWRETGFHFCHHTSNYDRFDSLPDWAIETLETHASDTREYQYTLEEFEQAKTHDPLWNAAQRQLVRDGIIHNYLRMLWGKKILEWSESPRIALQIMIELNNKYSIDGRDPNSYSGIFWVLGRFDRPWGPERPIFGKIRYMTSDSTLKKVKLKNYLKEYSRF